MSQSSPSFVKRYSRNRMAVAGAAMLAAIVIVALSATFLYPGDPWDMVGQPLLRPGADREFLFGTDALGRDVAAGIFHGARVSLFIGAAATAMSVLIGTTLGAVAGYYGGWIDDLLSRATDVFQDHRFTLDFNGSYDVNSYAQLYFNAKNLTNAPLRFYEGTVNRPIQREYYDATFEGGIKLKF